MGFLRMAAVLAAGTLLACGSSDSGSHAAPPVDCSDGCWEPTAEDEAFVEQLCTRIEACCVVNAWREASDVAGCKDALLRAGFSRDAALRAECLAELTDLAAAGFSCLPEAWDLSDACVRLVFEPSGPQPPGEPCVNRADCQGAPGKVTLCSGVTSYYSPTFGLCLQLTRGVPDSTEPCNGVMSPDGVILAAPRYTSEYGPPDSTGALCEDRAGLYCGQGTASAPGTCQRLSPDGAACNYGQTCASKECLTSDGTEAGFDRPGTCTKRVPAGQVCEDYVSRALCDEASFCRYNDDPDVPGGVCQTKLGTNAACSYDEMCASNDCDAETSTCSLQSSSEDLSLLGFCARF